MSKVKLKTITPEPQQAVKVTLSIEEAGVLRSLLSYTQATTLDGLYYGLEDLGSEMELPEVDFESVPSLFDSEDFSLRIKKEATA